MRQNQRQGLGSYLLKFIEKQISGANVGHIALRALKPEPFGLVINFYTSNGYNAAYEQDAKVHTWLKEYFPLKQWDILMLKSFS